MRGTIIGYSFRVLTFLRVGAHDVTDGRDEWLPLSGGSALPREHTDGSCSPVRGVVVGSLMMSRLSPSMSNDRGCAFSSHG
jgi:hypothetical protein